MIFFSSTLLSADTIDIAKLREETNLAPYISYIHDENGIFDIDEVMKISDEQYKPIHKRRFFRANGTSNYWLKLKIDNSSDQFRNLILTSELGVVDTATYYLVEDNQIISTHFSGKNYSGKLEGLKYPFPSFQFQLPSTFSGELYIKVNSCRHIYFPISIWDYDLFVLAYSALSFQLGFIFGSIILFIFASLVFYFLSRQKYMLLYLGYIIAVTLVEADYYGLIYKSFSHSHPILNHFEFLIICIIFFGLFIRDFFNTKDKHPIFDKYIIVLVIIESLEFVLRAGYHHIPQWGLSFYRYFDIITTFAVFGFSIYILVIAYKSYKKDKNLRYLWVFFSLITFFISVFFYILLITGNMPSYAIYVVLPISIFFEMVLMFIVFAYDYFELQKKQSDTQLALIISQIDASTNLLLGQEKERKRLAVELHDGVGTMISAIKMHFQTIYRDHPHLTADITYITTKNLINETYDEVRNISHNLMPLDVLELGLEESIRSISDKLFANNTMKIKFQFFTESQPINKEIQLNLYRITQEILKNICNHASASEILLQLTINDGYIHLEIENNGILFNVDKKMKGIGIGLKNITNRVAYLNGDFTLTSDIKNGTIYSILIPLYKST